MKRLLLVDKDETLKESFRLILPREEYDILYAKTGKEGMELAFKERPSVFIVNLNLPDMRGKDLLKNLKEKGIKGSFYVLKEESEDLDLKEEGIDGIIEKPINYLYVIDLLLRGVEESELLREKRRAKTEEVFREFEKEELEKELLDLKKDLEMVVYETVNEAKSRLLAKLEPLVKNHIETYVEKKLPEIAEKVLKKKIEKMIALLKK
ncbi:MAG: response regulator [Desulfobacterota bacterium]|nr:response regulator [Thermodesulfobacteriota bacterium]MDW8002303.1 response regulator [Deltaproteobacteria bacterium]